MAKRLKKSDVKVGMRVTCKRRSQAYYSNYGGEPECWFEPGDIGIVGAVDVPSIWREGVSFVCVDFEKVQRANKKNGKQWRCALLYDNIEILGADLDSTGRLSKTKGRGSPQPKKCLKRK